MNNVSLSGRLTKAPETRYGGEGGSLAISSFTIAVNDKGETDFINIKALGRPAEWVEKWLSKGMKVEVIGRIKTGHYTNKAGREVYYTEVLANELSFGESKAETEARQQDRGHGHEPKQDYDRFIDIPDGIEGELPFN